MRRTRWIVTTALAAMCAAARPAEVEVLHWWTSGGEARSVQVLKDMLAQQGHQWRDVAVAGGGGAQAMAALRSRVLAGRPPAAAQINGSALRDWGALKVLADLDEVAREQQWHIHLTPAVAELMPYGGHHVAVPVNVHRVNWLWINREALTRAGGRIPRSWDEFFVLAERLRKAGIVPLAHGGQPWQALNTFETVVLGVGGAAFYRRAFVALDPTALRSETMARALATFRRLKAYTDSGAPGREWNAATAMVVRGEAGMQLMGDWAKGEFLAAGRQPVRDFICTSAPGTDRAYSFVVDSFAMFRLQDPAAVQAQKALARTITSPAFQEVFNLAKGSIPAVSTVRLDRFDHCAQESSAYFVASSMIDTLVPSVTHKMASSAAVADALAGIVSAYWNDDSLGTDEAMARLAAVPGAAAAAAR